MGHTSVLRTGEIQVMTAGTGIIHSEFNNSPNRPVKFLQIWIFPDRHGLPTRYEEITLAPARTNELRTLVAPEAMVPSIRPGFISRPGSTPSA